MVTAESVKAKLRNLLSKLNIVTGKSDKDLTSGIDSLISQYRANIPSGSKDITSNGQYNVYKYASVNVSVPQTILTDTVITENGTHEAPDGYSYDRVTVDVEPKLQEKEAYGNGEVLADDGYDGLSKVIVKIPDDVPEYQNKTVTENGTYRADDGYDALSSVTVDVVPKLQPKEITIEANTDEPTVVSFDEDYDGLSEVSVSVDVPIPDGYIKPEGTMPIDSNGVFDVTEYSSVEVDVPIPDGYVMPMGTQFIYENGENIDVREYESVNVYVTPKLQIKPCEITENGAMITVSPDTEEGYEGLSEVTVVVNIPTTEIPEWDGLYTIGEVE